MMLIIAGFQYVSQMLVQSEASIPIQVGSRWTYVANGQEALIIDAKGVGPTRSPETHILRVRGAGGGLLWFTDDVFIASDQAGLHAHAVVLGEKIERLVPPTLLLPADLKSGKSWECSSYPSFVASVHDREEVVVPAGKFHSWKVVYKGTSDVSRGNHCILWVSPGTGIVRRESWQESLEGDNREPPHRVMELLRYEPHRMVTPRVDPPLSVEKLGEVVRYLKLLDSDEIEERERSIQCLLGIGRGVMGVLNRHLDDATSSDRKAQILAVLNRFPKLAFEARATASRGKVGEPMPVRFALVNLTAVNVNVLPALAGSTMNRYPRYDVLVCDERGVQQMLTGGGPIDSFENPIRRSNFVELAPGDEVDPFGPFGTRHGMLDWKPTRPGTYSVWGIYDASGTVPGEWMRSSRNVDTEIQRILEAMPRGLFRSERIEIVVDP